MTTSEYIKHIRQLIAKDALPAALESLQTLLASSPQLNEALLQSGRYEGVLQQIRLGLVTDEQANVTLNQIRFGLLGLLSEIEEQGAAQPRIAAELSQAAITVSHSKNVVAGSHIQAGGNVYIGDMGVQGGQPVPDVAFNELLTRGLIEAIKGYSGLAAKIATTPGWDAQRSNMDKVQLFLATSFVGVIGTQLSKLMAIGKEDAHAGKVHKYTEKLLFVAKRSLDLVCFTLVSALWDVKKQHPNLLLSDAQRAALTERFDADFELSFEQLAQLLPHLCAVFEANGKAEALSFSELKGKAFGREWETCCARLGRLEAYKDKKYDESDSIKAIEAVCALFRHLGFLVNYQMASVKRIGYHEPRNSKAKYLHRYATLGIDNKANIDAEKIDLSMRTAQTDAVLLFKGDSYITGVNLSPFVIDYNTLSFEQGSKVCFYFSRDFMQNDCLEYRYIDDELPVKIENTKTLDGGNINDLLMEKKNRISANLDNVAALFMEARRDLLGDDVLDFNHL